MTLAAIIIIILIFLTTTWLSCDPTLHQLFVKVKQFVKQLSNLLKQLIKKFGVKHGTVGRTAHDEKEVGAHRRPLTYSPEPQGTDVFLRDAVHNHVSSICSTWGREHFKTFDGDVYQFPGTCEYNLVSDCHESYKEFSVHMKRKDSDGNPAVSHVVVTINDLLFYLTKDMITVNDLPISPVEFGNRQKVHRPNEECEDPSEEEEEESLEAVLDSCKEFQTTCNQMLRSEPWSSCTERIDPEPYIQACVQDITCVEGRWNCESLQTPATCAIEEGSHVTTFDGKSFTFHGDCYYTLAKVESKDQASPKFTILVQLVPCANQEFDTCLKSLKILLNNDRNNALMFTSDGTVKLNMQTISLPYHSGDINVFHASSFHILLQTSFGLQIQIQHVPVMQIYVSLEQSYRAKTRGLCGNYNMVLSDDMKTPQGIVEGTAVTFSNSWKANLMCRDRDERLEDPCSLSMENELYAKHWCALLLSPDSNFTQCHSVVDPEKYYKRCVYASCNCEKNEDCLCAVFSSYARACASKGVFLTDWRENVCGCTFPKVYFNCSAVATGEQGLHCARTCLNLDSDDCNNCGNKTVQDNFGVITENVPCGSTGTTCSKTVRIQLGRMEVKLSKGKYEEVPVGKGAEIPYRIRKVGMYVVVESAIGLVVMWDGKTTVRIILEPQHSGEVCGLCGDFNDDGQNDFTTQAQLVVSNSLEFANSWKASSQCQDVAVFCDYYNNPDECKWHYNPCHKPCYKTCLNPDEMCSEPLPNLEGANHNNCIYYYNTGTNHNNPKTYYNNH
ncbi:Mucin-2 [Liparis tanakae]|uniref:Mucin-2 n=1 Tax=Liparis tanakae TaxID=230148 RepID=A0A4Z2J9Y2_9TELE|nr:Mucin-2 [Liparis tanakae]